MNIVISIVFILLLLLGAIGLGFLLVRFFQERQVVNKPAPAGAQPTPKKSVLPKINKTVGWISGIVISLLILIFVGPAIWSGTSSVIGKVVSQTGITEFLLVIGVVTMLATLFIPQVRGDRTWLISYAIVVGIWIISWAHIHSINYKHGISFMEHLRVPGILAMWILIPACAVAIYLVKNKWLRVLFFVTIWMLCGLVASDFRSSPKTARINSMRTGRADAQSLESAPTDISEAKWDWEISYPAGFDEYGRPLHEQVTDLVSILRDDEDHMSLVQKTHEGKIINYEWRKKYGRLGVWEGPMMLEFRFVQKVNGEHTVKRYRGVRENGTFRFESRENGNYYDGVTVIPNVGYNMYTILRKR